MHLGNGAITPECAALTWGVAAAGISWAGYRVASRPVSGERWLAAGSLAAALLAAQMINVPLLPGFSGHLLGGVLAALLLGPELAVLVLASVLAVQALAFGDGGLVAYGANLINMGLLPALLVHVVQRFSERRASAAEAANTAARAPRTGTVLGGALLAVLATVLAAGLLVAEVAAGRETAGLAGFAGAMLGSHLLIGLAEGLLTGLVLLAAQGWSAQRVTSRFPYAAAGLGGLVAAVLLACWPLGSALPDGYEMAAHTSGWTGLLASDADTLGQLGWLNTQAHGLQDALRWHYQSWSGQDTLAHGASALLLAALLPVLAIGLMTRLSGRFGAGPSSREEASA